MNKHGQRLDNISKTRTVAGREGRQLFWGIGEQDGRDVEALWRSEKQRRGLNERKRRGGEPAHVAGLVQVQLPKGFISEAGDPHDPANPRNKEALEHVRKAVESVWGKGSVFAQRIDLDEVSWGVVDVFILPEHLQKRGRTKAGKEQSPLRIISINQPLEQLAQTRGIPKARSYVALQDAVAESLAANWDERITRGKSKEQAGIDRLTPEQYGKAKDEALQKAQAKVSKEDVEAQAVKVLADEYRRENGLGVRLKTKALSKAARDTYRKEGWERAKAHKEKRVAELEKQATESADRLKETRAELEESTRKLEESDGHLKAAREQLRQAEERAYSAKRELAGVRGMLEEVRQALGWVRDTLKGRQLLGIFQQAPPPADEAAILELEQAGIIQGEATPASLRYRDMSPLLSDVRAKPDPAKPELGRYP